MSSWASSAPTLANVIIFVLVFTGLGWSGLLEGRGLLWALAWPALILLNAPLHEASHALAGLAGGQRIVEFQAWQLAGNYVRFGGTVGWPVVAAPFFRDLALFVPAAAILSRLSPRRRGPWMGLFMAGMLVPLWDTTLEYVGVFVGRSTDVAKLFGMLGPGIVHAWFAISLLAYLLVTALVLRRAGHHPGMAPTHRPSTDTGGTHALARS